MKSLRRDPLRFGSLCLALSGSIGLATLSIAAEPTLDPSQPAVHVRLADLNFSTPQGTAAAYKRIESAANAVCSQYDGRLLTQRTVFRTCVSGSIDAAVAEVGDARLTAYYQSKTGKSVSQEKLALVTNTSR